MDTNASPGRAPGKEGSGCFTGCAVALFLFVVLLAWGAHALEEFEKGLDGRGQLEQTGVSGSPDDPLGPGVVARYEDGMKVTVGAPRREADGTYDVTVTYENGTDEEVSFRDGPTGGAFEALEVREGEPSEDHPVGYGLDWLNWRECDSVLARPLGAGETREVPLRVRPSRRGIPATVIVGWPDGTYRDEAYFRLGLD